MSRTTVRLGFTILEVLVALAIVGVLAGIGAATLREPPARLAANSYRSFLQNARHVAISRNRPVLISADAASRTISMLVASTSAASNCEAFTSQQATFDATEYRQVAFTTDTADGRLLWLPNGRPGHCGGGIAGTTTSFSDGKRTFSVEVSPAGQVRVGSQ